VAALGGGSRRALVLIGFMGAGKSTVAAELPRDKHVKPLSFISHPKNDPCPV